MVCVPTDGMRRLGPTTGRDTSKQTPQETTCPTRIL